MIVLLAKNRGKRNATRWRAPYTSTNKSVETFLIALCISLPVQTTTFKQTQSLTFHPTSKFFNPEIPVYLE
ncbi:hypothetical protein J1614_003502 [Plenodomus biglobosus]|nr:hypothetical protein J1614_003502 [Plenodomus biglobosus]